MEAGEVQPVSLPEPAIVHHVDEGEGEDPEVDQVLPVDPGEADGQDRAQTERARGQRGMFAAGSCETDSDRGPKGEPDVYVVRTSTLTGLDVVNEKEKSLGSVSDMVVDLKTGQIQYVATSYGGFLGIGDKMFAIPWKALRFTHAKDNPDHQLLVLDMPQEVLEKAPGFNQNNWPGTKNSEYWVEVDRFYKAPADKAAEKSKDATKQ